MADLKKVLTDCFNDIDKDKSGFIEQAELEQLLRAYFKHADCPAEHKLNSSDEDIKKQALEFIKDVDTSGDKKISLEEFITFFTK
jgi:Ca2+-binding EF-hand superfamily protein